MRRRVLVKASKLIALIDDDSVGNLMIVGINDAYGRLTPHDVAVQRLDVDPFGRCRIDEDRLILSCYAAFNLFDKCWQLLGSDSYNVRRYLRLFENKGRAAIAVLAGVCASDGIEPPHPVISEAISSMTLGEKGWLALRQNDRKQFYAAHCATNGQEASKSGHKIGHA